MTGVHRTALAHSSSSSEPSSNNWTCLLADTEAASACQVRRVRIIIEGGNRIGVKAKVFDHGLCSPYLMHSLEGFEILGEQQGQN